MKNNVDVIFGVYEEWNFDYIMTRLDSSIFCDPFTCFQKYLDHNICLYLLLCGASKNHSLLAPALDRYVNKSINFCFFKMIFQGKFTIDQLLKERREYELETSVGKFVEGLSANYW